MGVPPTLRNCAIDLMDVTSLWYKTGQSVPQENSFRKLFKLSPAYIRALPLRCQRFGDAVGLVARGGVTAIVAKKRIRYGNAYLIPIVPDGKDESYSIEPSSITEFVRGKANEVIDSMPTKTRAASQQSRRGEDVAKIAVDTEGEHGGIVVIEMEVVIVVDYPMAEGTDHCVEQAQWAVRLAGPQASSKVPFLLHYIYLTRVHSTSPIPGRAYMHLILRFSEGDELSTRRQDGQWQAALTTPSLFPHYCTISPSLSDSPGDATPAAALSIAYTHTVAIADRVNEYPGATRVKVFTNSAYSFCGLTSSDESTYYKFLVAEYGTHSSSVTVKTSDGKGRLNAKGEAVSPPACMLVSYLPIDHPDNRLSLKDQLVIPSDKDWQFLAHLSVQI
ncbi:hypothetical protein EDD85DRAFT_797343 [Armillaria nabsnona]|nr:hypothetical protein EDD85DRAFT_797343 [Armillaria nabsnona]